MSPIGTIGHWQRAAWLACSTLIAATAQAQAPTATAGAAAYVSHQDGGIARIDLQTLTVGAHMPLEGAGPRGLGITDDGKQLVVAVREAGELQWLDIASQRVVQRVAVGKNPEFVRVRGGLAFVSYEPSSTGAPPKSATAASAATTASASGHAAASDDDGDKEPAQIAVVSLASGKVLRRIVGGAETEGIEVTPDGRRIVVTNEADNNLTVHDVKTGKRLQTIDVAKWGVRPRGIKVSPDGKHYAVTLEFANKVLVLDARFKPLRTVDTGAAPYGISFDRSGKRLFVAAARDKVVNVFDATTYAKLADIPVGERCWHFTFTPDDARLLVACGRSKDVVVVDANSYQVLQKLPAQGMPWGVVTWPKSFGSLDQP